MRQRAAGSTKKKLTRIRDWRTWSPAPVIGVDEVGRGCLAGPVYAAAVILDTDRKYQHFVDSKTLSVEMRSRLATEIQASHWVGIGFATAVEVDAINILQASFLAMIRAIEHLTERLSRCQRHAFVLDRIEQADGPRKGDDNGLGQWKLREGHVVVDGHLKIRNLPLSFQQTPVVKGDLRVAPVSAASIVAKVARDQFMIKLAERFPDYGFEAHKGYGTKVHQEALLRHGPCEFHRRSFAGVE